MSQLLDDLRRVRDFLTPPGAWIQGHYATDKTGRFPPAGDFPENCAHFCLTGAVYAVVGTFADDGHRVRAMLAALHRAVAGSTGEYRASCEGDLIIWNDVGWRSAQEVLDLVDGAIREAES